MRRRQHEILAFAVDIDELISSVCNISISMSSLLVMLLSIFASSLDINSSFRWSCSWMSFIVVRLSSFRDFSLLRSSARVCSIFVESSLNPCQVEINLFNSAIVCRSTKLYWVMTIVSVPVSVPRLCLVRIRLRYTKGSLYLIQCVNTTLFLCTCTDMHTLKILPNVTWYVLATYSGSTVCPS